jgi:hypothetical protein
MRLETYPKTRFARLVGTNAEINLYRLKEEPKLEKSGVVFEGLEDGFSLHPVVTPDSGIGLAFGSFPRDLPKEPEMLREVPITRSPKNVPMTPEPRPFQRLLASQRPRA